MKKNNQIVQKWMNWDGNALAMGWDGGNRVKGKHN